MEKKQITSNPEISQEVWNRLKERLEEIDPSRNYSDKHITELALRLSDHLLMEKINNLNSDISRIKRELDNMEEVLR